MNETIGIPKQKFKRKLNIEHRTSKFGQTFSLHIRCSTVDFGCSMFALFITQRLQLTVADPQECER